MTLIKLSEKAIVTEEFYNYTLGKLREIYPVGCGIKVNLDTISYERWDDSDQPGMDERMSLEMTDGRKFDIAMTHNRWENFKEVK